MANAGVVACMVAAPPCLYVRINIVYQSLWLRSILLNIYIRYYTSIHIAAKAAHRLQIPTSSSSLVVAPCATDQIYNKKHNAKKGYWCCVTEEGETADGLSP